MNSSFGEMDFPYKLYPLKACIADGIIVRARFGARANSRARILPSPEQLLPLATQAKQLKDHVFRANQFKK